jgi:hypothetical protein
VREWPARRLRSGGTNLAVVLLGGSAALAGLCCGLILTGHQVAAGVAGLGAAGGLVLGVARADTMAGRRGPFAAFLLDRTFDACILGALAWVSRSTAPRVSALALVAMGGAFTASYERAKAASLGYRAREAPAYIAVRSLLPVLGLLTGWVEASLWVLSMVVVAAVAVRAWNVAAQHRRTVTASGTGPAHGL